MDGFVDVTKDEFFAVTGPLDVHPRPERDRTYWELPSRTVVGLSRGYLCEGPKTWAIRQHLRKGAR